MIDKVIVLSEGADYEKLANIIHGRVVEINYGAATKTAGIFRHSTQSDASLVAVIFAAALGASDE